jgi:hypothetical protein
VLVADVTTNGVSRVWLQPRRIVGKFDWTSDRFVMNATSAVDATSAVAAPHETLAIAIRSLGGGGEAEVVAGLGPRLVFDEQWINANEYTVAPASCIALVGDNRFVCLSVQGLAYCWSRTLSRVGAQPTLGTHRPQTVQLSSLTTLGSQGARASRSLPPNMPSRLRVPSWSSAPEQAVPSSLWTIRRRRALLRAGLACTMARRPWHTCIP